MGMGMGMGMGKVSQLATNCINENLSLALQVHSLLHRSGQKQPYFSRHALRKVPASTGQPL